MKRKFIEIRDKIEKLALKLEQEDIEGPIPLLEEALELVNAAIEEYKNYEEAEPEDDDYENEDE